jgi:Fe-S oxidoreductase
LWEKDRRNKKKNQILKFTKKRRHPSKPVPQRRAVSVHDELKGKRFEIGRKHAEVLACGRTSSEEVESIRKYGNHGASPVLRSAVLAAHGIAKPQDTAKNAVIFGCYRPFTTPFLLRDYIRLMDLLSIDYTWLERENCCGYPLLMHGKEEQPDDCRNLCREFNRSNVDLARQKGADTLAYCCLGCAYAAKHALKDTADVHIYIVELILDKVANSGIKMKPVTVGYFEGCHSYSRALFPGTDMAWNKYDDQLHEIEGLTVVELPKSLCCKTSMEKILGKAAELKLDKIVCTCNSCYVSLKGAAGGKLNVLSLPEFLLQGMENC